MSETKKPRVRRKKGLIDTLLVCEKVTEEVGNKHSISGLTSNVLYVHGNKDSDKPANIALVLYLRIWADEGVHDFVTHLKSPNGKIIAEASGSLQIPHRPQVPHQLGNVVLSSQPGLFEVKSYGEYELIFESEGLRDSRKFYLLKEEDLV